MKLNRMSRRSFLKAAGMVGAGAAMPGLVRGVQRARAQDTTLNLWWWADEPAFGAWVDDLAARFAAANPGVSIETLQQDVCCVISQFTTAAAAGEPPDVAFLFNGLYHMENVWLGYIDPLEQYLPADLIANSGATVLSRYDGGTYRVGWYAMPMLWEYNKDTWDQAGLDADNPPTTWDAWMGAAEALKTAGFVPMGGGISDGFWGEWYLGQMLVQALGSAGEAIELFIGERDFREPQYWAFWARLEEMVSAGYLNDDMLSVDLFSAINKILTGELATTLSVGALVPGHINQIGDRVGLMIAPVYGEGGMAGQSIVDSQGFGIPSAAPNKELSAAVLEFMHTPESLNRFWELNRYFPSNTAWDSSVIDDATLKGMWDNFIASGSVPYIPNLMPGLFWTDAMFVSAQEIIAGNMTGEQAGEQNANIAQQWRTLNPDLIPNYQLYAQGLAE
jgi:ABC-type glycerol-3-phosphate transport system substrate-binding protein